MAAVVTVVALFAVTAVCLGVARAAARDQRRKRSQPIDAEAQRDQRYAQRTENVSVIRSMLFGRWATGRRDRWDDTE
jgi:hypothetical protein